MKVREVMKTNVKTCDTNATLDDAVRIMWDTDCGMIPIIDANTRRPVGVVTDRDVCIASWSQGRPLAEIPVTSPASGQVYHCQEHDEVSVAFEEMKKKRVKRLLVTDKTDDIVGVVSLAALAKNAVKGKNKDAESNRTRVVDTLAAFAQGRAKTRAASSSS